MQLSATVTRCLVPVGTRLANRTSDFGGGGFLLPFIAARLPFHRVVTAQSHGRHHKLPNGRATGVWECVAAANIRTPPLVPARGVRGLNRHEYAYGIPPVHLSAQTYPKTYPYKDIATLTPSRSHHPGVRQANGYFHDHVAHDHVGYGIKWPPVLAAI